MARPKRSMTIDDVAAKAGVSVKTVSRVLNREDGVSDETRVRVEDVVAALGYSPNASARSLSSRRFYQIGLSFIPTNGGYFYVGELQNGALEACRRNGYQLVLETIDPNPKGGHKAVALKLRDARIDGLLLPAPYCDDERLVGLIEARGLPFVRIGPDGDFERSPYVDIDDRGAAREVVSWLWSLGHRRIAFVEGPCAHSSARRRRDGYLDALRAQGVENPEQWLWSGDFHALAGFEAAQALLSRPEPPTAIFAGNDDMAVGVIAAANKLGVAVPGQLSVVGFDDNPAAASAWPPLSTVHQPIAAMAQAAAEMLIDGFASDRVRKKTASRRLQYRIVVRESVAAPSR